MPAPPYMRFYVRSYCKATVRMTYEEQGVYMRLLCTMWEYGGKIEDDDYLISKALPIQIQKWQKVKPQIMPFLMEHSPGFLTQKKLSEQFNSIGVDKKQNDGSNYPQPNGGSPPGHTQPPNQPPTQRPSQGRYQGEDESAATQPGEENAYLQRFEDIPPGGVAHALARALDQSRYKQNQNNNSRLLDDGEAETCGKLASDEEAVAFVHEAIDAFEKYRLHPPGDYSVIRSWIKNGCDLRLHVLPAVKAALGRHGGHSKPPKSWKYFTHEVYARKKSNKEK